MTEKGPPLGVYNRPPVDLEPLFSAAGHLTGIDPMLLKAIAMRESSLNPASWARSTGAVGLMSLEPQNWKSVGMTDPWDPGQNIMGGALLLRDNLKMYDGDLDKALQQYNGGNPSRWGGATQSYVAKVRNHYKDLTGQEAPEVLPQFMAPVPPPMLRPGPTTTPAPPVRLNMNAGPSDQPNLAQSQPAGPLPPSPFVQAFLTNAIFGGGSPPSPFAAGPGIRPGARGGR